MSVELLVIFLPIASLLIVTFSFLIYKKLSSEKSHLEKVLALRAERADRQAKLNSLLEKRKRREEVLRKKRP